MAKIMMNSLPPELMSEEIAELEKAEQMPIVFDEDCPELSLNSMTIFPLMTASILIGLDNFPDAVKQY